MSPGNPGDSAVLAGRQYRYDRFTTGLLFRDLRFRKEAARPGDSLPAFALVPTDGESLGKQDLLANKPPGADVQLSRLSKTPSLSVLTKVKQPQRVPQRPSSPLIRVPPVVLRGVRHRQGRVVDVAHIHNLEADAGPPDIPSGSSTRMMLRNSFVPLDMPE